MAISFNGSNNTIAGVAVGGLPDGIVDADMLAANAVTSGKLASGVGGKVVGFGLATSTAVDQYGAQNNYTLVGPQLTYTGESASNKLLILHNHHMVVEDASYWFMALWRDGLSGTKLVEKKWYSQEQMWIGLTGIHSCLIDIPDTSSHTYQFATYRTSGTNRLSYNFNLGIPQIIALEIDPS